MTDYFELSDLSLDDAMITYASNGYATVYDEPAWKEFKEFYKCNETPTELFDRFWDDIMPNINNYEIVRQSPYIAETLSRIYNPRKYPPPPPKAYDNVKEISLLEFQKQQNEAMQQKVLNDPKMLAFKAHCLDYIKKLQAEQQTQSETNKASTNRGSLHMVDQSVLEQRARQSSRDSRVGRMSGVSHASTSSISPEMDQPTLIRVPQSTLEQRVRRSSSNSSIEEMTRGVSQNPTSSTPLPGIDQSTMEQRIRQLSSHSEIRRGTQKRASRDSTSQRSTSEMSTPDVTIVLDSSESESESGTPRKRRSSADVK